MIQNLRIYIISMCTAACLAMPVKHAYAMSVQPTVVDMAVSGRDAKTSIQVVNDGTKPLPVDFNVMKVEIGQKGEQVQKPAGDEFLIFPPQAILPPGGAQTFRVQWVGDVAIKKSQSFIFSVNQLPVKMKANESGVQVVFNFSVVVNVSPIGGQSLIKYVNADIGKDDKGTRRAVVVVENAGTMHGYLSEANITLESGAWRQSLPAAQLRHAIGLGLVQPGKQRRFILPVDLPATVTQISARVDYVPRTTK